jgi:hypothetical protein
LGWGLAALFVIGSLLPSRLTAQEAQAHSTPRGVVCLVTLDSMEAVLARDYSGYSSRLPEDSAAYRALTDSVRAVAGTSDDYHVCIPALQRITRFFRDRHLMIWQSAPPEPAPSGDSGVAKPPARSSPAAVDSSVWPSVRRLDDSTALIRIPDLAWRLEPVIDSVVSAHWTDLLATPYLIIDMRGNSGGCTCSYHALLPLLYVSPIKQPRVEVWTSPANVAMYRRWSADPTFPADAKASIDSMLPTMTAHPNQFVVLAPATEIRLDTIFPKPRRIAVLVDSGCASSCEDFVLAARQSFKVTVMGTSHTAGYLGYGNLRGVWLPGWRRMMMPTTRFPELNASDIGYDGIEPEVLIPKGEPDPVEFARRYLRSSNP